MNVEPTLSSSNKSNLANHKTQMKMMQNYCNLPHVKASADSITKSFLKINFYKCTFQKLFT